MNVLACTANNNTYKGFQSQEVGVVCFVCFQTMPSHGWEHWEGQIQILIPQVIPWGSFPKVIWFFLYWYLKTYPFFSLLHEHKSTGHMTQPENSRFLNERGTCSRVGAFGHLLLEWDFFFFLILEILEKVSAIKNWKLLKELQDYLREEIVVLHFFHIFYSISF